MLLSLFSKLIIKTGSPHFVASPVVFSKDMGQAQEALEQLMFIRPGEDWARHLLDITPPSSVSTSVPLPQMYLIAAVQDSLRVVCQTIIHAGSMAIATRFSRWKHGSSPTWTSGVVRNLFSTYLSKGLFYPFFNEASVYLCYQRYTTKDKEIYQQIGKVRTMAGFSLVPLHDFLLKFVYHFSWNVLWSWTTGDQNIQDKSITSTWSGIFLKNAVQLTAGTIGALVSYPLETVRRGMVMQEVVMAHPSSSSSSREKIGFLAFVTKLYEVEGIQGFYSDFATNTRHMCLRHGIVTAVAHWCARVMR